MRVPSDQALSASHEQQEDGFYKLPYAVDLWVKAAQASLPEGWRLVPWTLNRAVTLKNSRGETHHVFTYEYIIDGGEFYLENNEGY